MSRWIANFPSSQVVYFAACEILSRGMAVLGIKTEPLGKHFDILAGYAFKSGDYTTDGVRLLRNVNVKPDRIDWSETVHLPANKAKDFDRFQLFSGDLVLSMDGTVNKQGIKIAFLSDQDIPSLLLQRVCRFNPIGNIDTRFLYHILHSEDFLDHVADSNRSIAIPHVSPGQLKSFHVPIPPRNLQASVCDLLDAIRLGKPMDDWPNLPLPLAAQRRTVAQIEELVAQIDEATTIKRETKAQVDTFWKVCSRIARNTNYPAMQLEDVVDFLDGRRIPLSQDQRSTLSGPYPYYGASGIIDYIDNYIFDEPLLLLSEDGANLINRSTPIAFIAEGKYWVNNHAHVLKPKPDLVNMKFLAYALSDYDVSAFNFASAQAKLNQANARKISFPLPPIDEQDRIVTELEALQANVDKLKYLQAETAAELDALLPSILDRAFRGEL
jgi:type I restriction enzyme, S subunit